MTPESFKMWLADMKFAGLARSDAQCARLLGVTHNTLFGYKTKGASNVVALACRALRQELKPYA